MRVYEVARERGLSSKEVIKLLTDSGFDASSHMSVLDDSAVSFLEKHFGNQAAQSDNDATEESDSAPENEENSDNNEESKASTIKTQNIRSQSNGSESSSRGRGSRNSRNNRGRYNNFEKPQKKVVTEILISSDMALFEAAELMGKSSGDLILALMRKGMVCNRNHILTKDIIASLATDFGISVISKGESARASIKDSVDPSTLRWPVIVIMGHVDHGKTTLLDFIRKTRVAEGEKGGITQSLGAYEVESNHGKLVFLDTPGHAAFSQMRKRGIRITDIAVLVVAVDDGVMPQTVESIKAAKAAGVTIVVAITKVDKATSPTAIETVKRQLSQHGLMPEDWGGDTICVSLSAKTGEGVDEFLDMLVLQSEIMELKANPDNPAKAFVLESKLEKGHGAISTIICADGTIKQGDFFICGDTKGKVRLLIDSNGKRLRQAGPSTPVKVVGFDALSSSGDVLQVVSYDEYAGKKPVRRTSGLSSSGSQESESVVNIIVKGDTYGAIEAVCDLIQEIAKKTENESKKINIVSRGVGGVSESDAVLAHNTAATIIAMNVRVERNAASYLRENCLSVIESGIIYRIMEDFEALLKKFDKPVVTQTTVGEAEVIKVFDIKGVGIIAGARVKSGVFKREGSVVCIRDGEELGTAKITSLQRNKKTVKEVSIDTEFAFVTKDFQDWQLGDAVRCVIETIEGP